MSNVINSTYTEFTKKRDIASFIKLFSVITWEKIGFVRRQNGLKFYEVTATQNLLFQFRILTQNFPSAVRMYEAVNEKTNGNDIELFIELKEGSIFFPCQAKIVDRKGVYKSIEHPHVPKKSPPPLVAKQQIMSLIDYANNAHKRYSTVKKGVPIYLFYNYSATVNKKNLALLTSHGPLEVYGCSYLNANQLVGTYFNGTKPGWKKPTFNDLHPSLGKPFYTLFDLLGKSKRELTSIGVPESVIDELPTYQLSELNAAERDYWRPVSEPSSANQTFFKAGTAQEEAGFRPRYRIEISSASIESEFVKWLLL